MRYLLLIALAFWVSPVLADEGCQDIGKEHSEMLNVPSSAKDVTFQRCGASEKVTFRVQRPFPGQDVVDLIQKRWESKGWYPVTGDDDSWKRIISPDKFTATVVRKLTFENQKGRQAVLTLAYLKKFEQPILSPETIDLGEDLRVLAVLK